MTHETELILTVDYGIESWDDGITWLATEQHRHTRRSLARILARDKARTTVQPDGSHLVRGHEIADGVCTIERHSWTEAPC